MYHINLLFIHRNIQTIGSNLIDTDKGHVFHATKPTHLLPPKNKKKKKKKKYKTHPQQLPRAWTFQVFSVSLLLARTPKTNRLTACSERI